MKYQQGDVLFIKIDRFDKKGLKKLDSSTIQEGEVTGHSHVVTKGKHTVYEDATYNKFVNILSNSVLRHEEHKPLDLPKGNYKVRIVREVDHLNNIIRKVVD